MFIRQFNYLVALEQEGHFGRAAQRCNVSQPSLSSAIKHLEEELGIPIILRHQKFQGFTEEGRRVVEWAKRILADRDAMLEELAVMHRDLHGNLRIGAMPMSSPILPIINRLFLAQHPAVKIDISFLGLDKMKLGLTNFELDVGLTYLEHEPLERLKTLPLYEERWSLLVPDNDWLGGKDRTSVTWAEAAELPLCLLSPSMHERQIMDKAFESIGGVPRPRLESNSIYNLAAHVMHGELATVIPSRFVQEMNAFPDTRHMRLEEPILSQKVGLVWAEGDPMLPMTKSLVTLMESSLESGKLDYPLTVEKAV